MCIPCQRALSSSNSQRRQKPLQTIKHKSVMASLALIVTLFTGGSDVWTCSFIRLLDIYAFCPRGSQSPTPTVLLHYLFKTRRSTYYNSFWLAFLSHHNHKYQMGWILEESRSLGQRSAESSIKSQFKAMQWQRSALQSAVVFVAWSVST